MAEKRLNSRIINKHDTESNWLKATNFIPMLGEVIIYDKDNLYQYERLKIGDGVTNVNDLPFVHVQPDWTQNDENAADYVRGRTHYDAPLYGYVDFENGILTETPVGVHAYDFGGGVIDETGYIAQELSNYNEVYCIFDGVKYKTSGWHYTGSDSCEHYGVGNAGIMYALMDHDTGEPFVIHCKIDPETNETATFFSGLREDACTIEMFYVKGTSAVPLDEKYIPDSVARVSQIPTVSQPDWNASEGEAGHVKNRTHYEDVKYQLILPETNIEHETRYDGSPTGILVDVHRFACEKHGSPVKIIYDDVEYIFHDGFSLLPYYSDMPDDYGMTKHHVGNPSLCPHISSGYGLEENDIPFCVFMESPGNGWVYFADGGSHNIVVYGGEKEIKPLDPKFLATNSPAAHQQLVTDGDGNTTWADRLAYEGISTEELLSVDNFWDVMRENTTPEGEDPDDATPIPADTSVYFPEMPVIENFNDGAEYYVYINDTKLETTIKENGNLGIDFSEIYDGYSYSYIGYSRYYGEMYLFATWHSGDPEFPEENVTFKIVRVGETVVPIPDKYIPNTIARTADFVAITDDQIDEIFNATFVAASEVTY